MRAARSAAALLLAGFALLARAHDAGTSASEVAVRRGRVEATLRISAADLAAVLGRDPATGAPDPVREGARSMVETLGRFAVSWGGAPCPLEPGEVHHEPPDGVRVTGAFRCDRPGGALQIRVGMLERMPWGHTHLAKVAVDARTEEHVVRSGRETFVVLVERPWR